MKIRRYLTLLMTLFGLAGGSQSAFAQGTAFTYQGRLVYAGNSATGNYDLTFQLWDSLSGGTALSGVITNADLAVTNGLFTVTLDFGSLFPGSNRYLELGVRTNGDPSTPSILVPRILLTPTPYSITAGGISGTLPDSQLSTNVPLLNGNPVFSGTVTVSSLSGNGFGLTNLNATNLTGQIQPGDESTNTALLNAANTFTGSNVFNGGIVATNSGVNYYMVPQGGIILWSGSVANIPAGWALCDGTQGTPNLEDKFVVGAGNSYAVGATGGATTHTHGAGSFGTAANSTGTGTTGTGSTGTGVTDSAGAHTHSIPGLSGGSLEFGRGVSPVGSTSGGTFSIELSSGGGTTYLEPSAWTGTTGTGTSGSAGAHTHNVPSLSIPGLSVPALSIPAMSVTGTSGSASSLPPYYALCYIMKL
jgi:hypothetical protein